MDWTVHRRKRNQFRLLDEVEYARNK